MDDFQQGDVVRIITPEEFRALGRDCSDKCAIAYYADSICRLEESTDRGYRLSPITVVHNFPHEENLLLQEIEYYNWLSVSLELYKEPLIQNDGFIDVF